MEEQFIDVLPWSEVPNLLRFYEDPGMDYYTAYLMLENINRWHLSFPECDSFILCPDGKINDCGTFMAVYPYDQNTVDLIFEDKNPNPEMIKPFLRRCIEFISNRWKSILFGPIKEKYWSVLDETASLANLSKRDTSFARCYYMDRELVKNLSLECPENMYIAPVREEHADLINLLWPHRFEGSVNLIRTIILRNGGLGIYLKETDELVSWGLHGLYNGPSNVQTVEKHLRKGFGSVVTVAISKFVADKGLHPFFFVITENFPAHNLYSKLGFNKSGLVEWCFWKKLV